MTKAIVGTWLAIFQSVVLCAQLGEIDPSFDPGTGFTDGGSGSEVEIFIQQPDGKILAGGWFSEYNGTPANMVARLNLDGSIDNSFNTGNGFTGVSGYVKALALQPDGKVLVGGNFLEYNGTTRHRIARLNSDGSLDMSFDPGSGFNSDVNSIVLQPDGKIIVAGIFSAYDWLNSGGIPRASIARLNSDGSLDASFDPGAGFGTTVGQRRVHKIILQPDGKILACGQFTSYDAVPRFLVARINADGSLDNSFDAGENFTMFFSVYGEPWDMKLQADGRILLAGNFKHMGAGESGVVRLNSDGSIDNSLDLYALSTCIGLQPDGKIYLSDIGPYTLRRYMPDGSRDDDFPSTTFNDVAQTILIQYDGNVLIGGWFSYNPSGLMRLIGDNPSPAPTGLQSQQFLSHVRVFPNPASDVLNLELNQEAVALETRFSLYNAIGQEIYHTLLQSSIESISLANLPDGLYFYRVSSPSQLIKSGELVVRH